MIKKKPKTLTKLKGELWKVFSTYIKFKYSKDGEWCNCFTCGNPIQIGTSNCQGGHYYTKKGYPGLYFNEDNVRPQCYHCNINLSGNTVIFGENLKAEIGAIELEKLDSIRHLPVKVTRYEYENLIIEYKNKLMNLKIN